METLKNFKIALFEQCHSAEICKSGDPLEFFDIHCVAKYKKVEGETLWRNPKSFCSGHRCFCCGRGSGVSSMLWTSVVQVDDVEQMNKKVDRSRRTDEKKLATVRKRRLKILLSFLILDMYDE